MRFFAAITHARPLAAATGALFLFHAAITLLAAITLGESAFISWKGAGLIIALDVCVWLSLHLADRRSAPILLTTAWFMLLFFLPRLTTFQLFPAQNIGFVALEPFSPAEIEAGTTYIFAGYLAIWGSIWAVSRIIAQQPASTAAPPSMPLVAIVIYSTLAFAACYYIYFIVGISVFAEDPTQWGSRIGWVSIIFNIDVALLVAIVWMVLHPSAKRRHRFVLIFIIAIWLAFALALGSRGGPLRILILLGLAAIAIQGNPMVSWARMAVIITVAFLASSVMYPLATLIRLAPASGEQAAENLAADWFRSGPVTEISASRARMAWVNSTAVTEFARFTSPIVTRLGLIDYPIAIVAREPDRDIVDHYLSIPYGLKNFANNLVPGELFPEHDVMTSRVFTMAYRGYDEQHIRSSFLSEPWTLWGFAWLKGGALGGLFIIVGLAAVAQFGYAMIPSVMGPMLTPYASSAYLFVPVSAGMLQLFGIDHALTAMAHFGGALLLLFGIALVVSRFVPAQQAESP